MNERIIENAGGNETENIITVKDLKKTFKVHQRDKSGLISSFKSLFAPHTIYVDAVKDINLTVKKGEIRGLIGPNGAGKSTTIKILSGILFPTEGTVDVLGYTPWTQREELVKRIGVVLGQKSQLWWDLPPIDAFSLNKKMYEIPDQLYKENLEYFSKALRIEDVIKKPVRQLSLGERMKCEFVAAMLHHPPLVFLDEPTIGLDMISKEAIRSFVKDVNKTKGTTFIVTTHDMGDIEDLCRDVTIINKGTIVYDGSIENLHTYFADRKVIELKFSREVSEAEIKGLNATLFDPFTASVVIDATKTNVKAEIARLLEILPVRDININGISIEEVIKQIYEQ
jgi:ABC-2 type transport system ATP-binding protein